MNTALPTLHIASFSLTVLAVAAAVAGVACSAQSPVLAQGGIDEGVPDAPTSDASSPPHANPSSDGSVTDGGRPDATPRLVVATAAPGGDQLRIWQDPAALSNARAADVTVPLDGAVGPMALVGSSLFVSLTNGGNASLANYGDAMGLTSASLPTASIGTGAATTALWHAKSDDALFVQQYGGAFPVRFFTGASALTPASTPSVALFKGDLASLGSAAYEPVGHRLYETTLARGIVVWNDVLNASATRVPDYSVTTLRYESITIADDTMYAVRMNAKDLEIAIWPSVSTLGGTATLPTTRVHVALTEEGSAANVRVMENVLMVSVRHVDAGEVLFFAAPQSLTASSVPTSALDTDWTLDTVYRPAAPYLAPNGRLYLGLSTKVRILDQVPNTPILRAELDGAARDIVLVKP